MRLEYRALIESLPGEFHRDLNVHGECLDRTIVVLDDDPTGCQTVHDVPILFSYDTELIKNLFEEKTHMFFILMNTRSMTPENASLEISAAMKSILQASEATGRIFEVVSRSDSTLRGHFPLELDVISKYLHDRNYTYCLIPAFFQGGRYTYNDNHYVREGQMLIPAADTPYAKDPDFGFSHSNLRKYIEEKTEGTIKEEEVLSISIDDLRTGGPVHVKLKLLESAHPACVVNALAQSDLDVFAAGAWEAMLEGKQLLVRTAASFLNSFACIPIKEPLEGSELSATTKNGGLFLVGSYVPKTTSQLEHLIENGNVIPMEISVHDLLKGEAENVIKSITSRAGKSIADGKSVVIFTSREIIKGDGSSAFSEIGTIISDVLIEIVRQIREKPAFVVVKGGITSHVIACDGYGLKRAYVLGQALPGVPVIVSEGNSGFKYIIFPGNVGEQNALTVLHNKLIRK